MSAVSDWIENLPEGYLCGGDNAYINADHLLVPFPGHNLSPKKNSFNYFLSQLRICIENAFALLVRWWGILWRPLNVGLKNQTMLVESLFKLHNFCIDEKERPPPIFGPSGLPPAMSEVHTEDHFNTEVIKNRSEWLTAYQFQREIQGDCLRDNIANAILEKNYVRPRWNLERNAARMALNETGHE